MAEEMPRRRLGRGLAALIGDVGTEPASEARRPTPPKTLPVSFLSPNPRNPRKDFDSAELDDLAASVRERGVVQPILVRQTPGSANAYEIIAGERRWRAAQKVGLHDVPVLVLEATDREALELAIIENVQRTDLNALEEALGYQQLVDEHGYSQGQLAEVIGKSRSHIANTLRLLKLPERVQHFVRSGPAVGRPRADAGHAARSGGGGAPHRRSGHERARGGGAGRERATQGRRQAAAGGERRRHAGAGEGAVRRARPDGAINHRKRRRRSADPLQDARTARRRLPPAQSGRDDRRRSFRRDLAEGHGAPGRVRTSTPLRATDFEFCRVCQFRHRGSRRRRS